MVSVSRRALLGLALKLPFALKKAATLELEAPERPFSIPQFIDESWPPTYQGVPLKCFADLMGGEPPLYFINDSRGN